MLDSLQYECVDMIFLTGLNEQFVHVRGQIFPMNPMTSIDQLYALVSQFEKQRQVGSPGVTPETTMACVFQHNYAKSNRREYPTYVHCRVVGHLGI